jgi:hypothetical protein
VVISHSPFWQRGRGKPHKHSFATRLSSESITSSTA